MKRAVFPMTDEERAEEEAKIQRILREVQFFEPSEPEPTGAAAAYVLLGACAVVSFGLGALIVWWL